MSTAFRCQADCSALAILLVLLVGLPLDARLPSSEPLPNILLILADDLGVECVGAYGGRSYETPHVDRLAAEGMRFTHCFSNPLCSPSRAQLLTGRYPLHNGMRRVIYDARRHREFLDPRQETSFANLLRDAGYATAIAGKWQVSFLFERDTVRDLGFDEYQCWKIVSSDHSRNLRYANPVFVRNGKTLRDELEGRYGPDVNAEFLIDFMKRNRDRPFLAYHAMLLPHFPWEPTPDSGVPLQGVPGMGRGNPKYFPDMVAYMDKLVGRMVQAVDDLGLSRRTLILLAADNGTQQPLVSRWGPDGRIVQGGKGKLADTGTRVPLIARWTGTITPGAVCHDLIDFSDFLPTFVELAGARWPERSINGRSFLPQLRGKRGRPRTWVHVQDQHRRYVRSREWILTNRGELRPVVEVGREAAAPVRGPLTPEQTTAKEELSRALREAAFQEEAATVEPRDARAAGFQYFITRRGDRLFDGNRPYRFVGVNMPGLVLPYDYWCHLPERMRLPTTWEQEDGLKTLARMGMTCVRTWNLPIRRVGQPRERWRPVWGPGEFNEEAFIAIDRFLALANRYGVRIIFPLTADAGDYLGGVGDYAAHRDKERKEFFSDPTVKADFRATLEHVLTRVNTITGVPYREDRAILAWQFGNEMDRTRPGEVVQARWQKEMAAAIKSLDPNHLLAYGRRFYPATPDENVDIIVDHYYGENWAQRLPADVAKTTGKRPFVISEFGMLTEARPYRELLDRLVDSGTAGILVWSMYFHHRDGGFWWHAIPTDRSQGRMFSYHWPGFSIGESIGERGILAALREASFRIRGLPIAPRTPPEPPELLPFWDIPMFSWRGSAGAASYDIERAPSEEGPWSRLAEGISDADVAYRPLFSDTTAEPGETLFYRVIARNVAGASPPSNMVGPVRIKGICLPDELKDFSRVEARHGDLKLDNCYGSYYCEYLYRVRGQRGAWLLYRTRREVDRVEIVAWNPKASPAFAVSTSRDGREYQPVAAVEKKIRYKTYDGREVSELRVTATPTAQARRVRIEFLGPVELDRVELYCGVLNSQADEL